MFILGIIGLVMSAASAAFGIASSIQAANAQSKLQQQQAQMQAASLREQAEQEEQDQLQRSMIERRQNARKLAAAVSIARKTLTIVRENVVFALGVKFLVLVLSALGYANMWAAVFADVGVSVIAILNASRMLGVK